MLYSIEKKRSRNYGSKKFANLRFGAFILPIVLVFTVSLCRGQSLVEISTKPLNEGQISSMVFGNFVELLDDVVPSMWAEMLNDRDFAGITSNTEWVYYHGEPNVYLDRPWEENSNWSRVNDESYEGLNSAKIIAVDPSQANDSAGLSQSGLFVEKGKTYHFSGWFKMDAELKVVVRIKSLLPDGTWSILASEQLTTSGNEWKNLTVSLKSSGTTDRAVFEILAIGKGTLWVDKLSLMPEDNIDGWRKDAIELIRPIKPAIVRWGGSVCDPGGYKWKNGIGPRDKRVPFANIVWGRFDCNDVGIDEFVQFCRLIDAEPLICVSFADGAESAADLVRYCNDPASTVWGKARADNGYPEPYKIKYFQLGNELGGEDYATKCVAFCKAIKEADPGIKIAASYVTQRLLNVAGKDLTYVCPHHYSPDLQGHEREMKNLMNMIRSTPGSEHVRLGITEWAFTGGDWGNGRARLQSLYSALYSAQYFNLMMRNCDAVALACRSNMSNSFEGGTIMTRPGAVMKTPFYHTTKLYVDHFEPVPITIKTAPSGVDTFACRSEDGKTIAVFLVNNNRHVVDVRFAFTEGQKELRFVKGGTVHDTRNMGQLEIINHFSAPDRISTTNLTEIPKSLPRYSITAFVVNKSVDDSDEK